MAATEKTAAEEAEQIFSGIGCESIADVELPSTSSAYFKIEEGKNKVRVLQGPVLSYISQVFDEVEKKYGEKKFYDYKDPEAQKDKNAQLMTTYLVWDYKTESVVIWEISQKTIIKAIKDINDMQPDLSGFDLGINRGKEGGRTTYSVSQGPNSPFKIQEAIDQVNEKNILVRLEELKENADKASEEEAAIEAEAAEKSKDFN